MAFPWKPWPFPGNHGLSLETMAFPWKPWPFPGNHDLSLETMIISLESTAQTISIIEWGNISSSLRRNVVLLHVMPE